MTTKVPPIQRIAIVDGVTGPDLTRAPSPRQAKRTDDDLYRAPPASRPVPATVFAPRPPRTANLRILDKPRSIQPRQPRPRFAPPEVQALWRRTPHRGRG